MFGDILDRNKAFLDYKNGQLKNSENWHFSKGVCPLFWFKKIEIFPSFSFRQNRQQKSFKRYSRQRQSLSRLKKEVKKVEKLGFSKEVRPWFWSKIGNFPSFYFRQISQENVFHDILEKKAFLDYKNKKLKKIGELRFFQKDQSMVLVKNPNFSTFLTSCCYNQEKRFFFLE